MGIDSIREEIIKVLLFSCFIQRSRRWGRIVGDGGERERERVKERVTDG